MEFQNVEWPRLLYISCVTLQNVTTLTFQSKIGRVINGLSINETTHTKLQIECYKQAGM